MINHCRLAHPDPELEQRYIYAHGILHRLKKGFSTRADIEIELSKQSDEKEIRQILNQIRGNK